MITTTPAQTVTAPDRRSSAGRWAAAAGAAYVASWIAGLATTPTAPDLDAPATVVAEFYAEHGGTVLLSSSLVHGTAGLALLAFAAAIATASRAAGGLRRVVVGAGATAAVLSLTQVVLAVLAVTGADRSTADTSKALLDAINLVDVVKIACLAAFVAVATTATARAGLAPRWLRVVATAVVPLLLVGSAAFLLGGSVLMSVLALSLVGLLTWAGGTAVHVGLRAR